LILKRRDFLPLDEEELEELELLDELLELSSQVDLMFWLVLTDQLFH